jgi:hypothetical protein
MTAIQTYFIGPTNYRGSRYKAVAMGTGHSITIGADDAVNYDENHRRAAMALVKRQGWTKADGYADWYQGDGGKLGYVFVCGLERDLVSLA